MANYKYEEVIKIEKYFVKQKSVNDCAAACLTMIFKIYGLDIDIDEVKNEMIMDSEGANAYEIIRIAKKHGINAFGYKDFDVNKAISFPFIAHTINNKMQHFVVVIKVTLENVYVLDPAKGNLKLSKEDFNKVFTGVIIGFKENKYTLKNILKDKKFIGIITLLIIFLSILNVSYSYVLSFIVNNLNTKLLFSFIFLLFVLGLLKEIITFIKKRLLLDLQVKTDLRITLPTIRRILSLPLKAYSNLALGNLTSKFNDLSFIKEMAYYVSEVLFVDLIIIFVFLLSILFINVKLFFVNVFVFLLIFLLNKRFYKKYHYRTYDLQVKNEQLESLITDTLNGIINVKNLSKEYYFNKNLKNKYKNLINDYNTTSFIYIKKEFIFKIIFTILYFLCFIILTNTNITSVNLLFIIYIEMVLLDEISTLYNIWPIYANYKSAKKRLDDIYDINEVKTGFQIRSINSITFNNLNYKYDNKLILKNINLKIDKGTFTLISGKSGVGKTTLFKILTKQLSIRDNMLFIDNVDINDIEDFSLRRKITYVDQKARLFNKTIYENIYLGSKNTLGKNVKKIIDDMILKNNLSYNYVIDNINANISGGQRQLIIIAQSLVNQSNVIIFDETTSQLDEALEKEILCAIKKDYPLKTIILISHRMTNKDMFDNVVILENANKTKKED